MRRLPSTSTKRVLWFRLPSTLFNLKGLRPRSLRRSISPVRKYQRAGAALKWVAYSAGTGGGLLGGAGGCGGGRVHGEADQLQFGRTGSGILDAVHLVAHHGAGARAG